VELVPNGNNLVIRVVELPIINLIDFEGNKRVKDEELTKLISSKERRVYSAAIAESDAAAIADLYTARARLAATVDPKLIRRDNGRVDLVFEIIEGKVVENESIAFVGNRSFSDSRLRRVLQTKQAGFFRQLIKADSFNADRLELDKQVLRDFYLSRGYIDVQVGEAVGELSRERDATFVSYNVTEGQVYRIGDVSLVSEIAELDTADVTKELRLDAGVTYSPSKIETNITRLEAVAQRKGLNFVQIEPRIKRDPKTQTLNVEFVVKRGKRIFVERIDIEGNTTTLDAVVRRQFKTSEGDPFNPREVRQAAERIRALGFFEQANIDAAAGSAADQVVLNVDVTEAPTGSISFGLTFGSSAGAGGNLGYSETNFLGRGQGLNLTLQATKDTQDFSFGFVEPSFLGRDVKLKLNSNYNATSAASANYDTKTISFSPAVDFPVGAQSRFELRYRLASDEVVANGTSSTLIQAEAARGAEVTSSLGYSFSYDNRRTGLNPLGGVLLRFSQDFAGLGGDAKYLSTTGLAVAERKVLQEEVTLRAIVEGGAIASYGGYGTRVTDRFFGAGKIRGFERNGIGPRESGDALGGNMYTSVRFEADFPLGLPQEYGITGGAFYDIGSVWGLDDIGSSVGADYATRQSVGVSMFWDTPIGPLRLNFSRTLEKQTFDLDRNFELTISSKF
jgi:outer membrane protein insertion porin family